MLTYHVSEQDDLLVELMDTARERGRELEADAIMAQSIDDVQTGSHRVVARSRAIRRLRALIREDM